MREEEEFRPVLRELMELVLWACVIITAALAVPIGLDLFPAAVLSLLGLVLTAAILVFVAAALRVYWIHSTDHYAIGQDYVRIERRTIETSWIIPFSAVTGTECRCIPFTRSRIGSVVIFTVTGFRVALRNVKDPRAVAERIKPVAGEPILRPSVG